MAVAAAAAAVAWWRLRAAVAAAAAAVTAQRLGLNQYMLSINAIDIPALLNRNETSRVLMQISFSFSNIDTTLDALNTTEHPALTKNTCPLLMLISQSFGVITLVKRSIIISSSFITILILNYTILIIYSPSVCNRGRLRRVLIRSGIGMFFYSEYSRGGGSGISSSIIYEQSK